MTFKVFPLNDSTMKFKLYLVTNGNGTVISTPFSSQTKAQGFADALTSQRDEKKRKMAIDRVNDAYQNVMNIAEDALAESEMPQIQTDSSPIYSATN